MGGCQRDAEGLELSKQAAEKDVGSVPVAGEHPFVIDIGGKTPSARVPNVTGNNT
jgi:hypothetical protein